MPEKELPADMFRRLVGRDPTKEDLRKILNAEPSLEDQVFNQSIMDIATDENSIKGMLENFVEDITKDEVEKRKKNFKNFTVVYWVCIICALIAGAILAHVVVSVVMGIVSILIYGVIHDGTYEGIKKKSKKSATDTQSTNIFEEVLLSIRNNPEEWICANQGNTMFVWRKKHNVMVGILSNGIVFMRKPIEVYFPDALAKKFVKAVIDVDRADLQ
jgi:hypothetical protein